MRLSSREIMARAIELGRREMRERGVSPFAAVIVRDGEIIGEGCNDTAVTFDPTAHGEVVAIRDATRRLGSADLSGATLYTTCEPCSMCVAAMWWARIDKLVYAYSLQDCLALGIDCAPLVAEVSKPVEARALPSEQLMAEEAHGVFTEWMASGPAMPR
ncbi:nucleoside deaminase [Chthonobacter rhizosphaerae]|uniref:nucleoside deaminase n=1 Tax=Chthonobacter rhizosphaerae TaxID=2735553 RepID=UPI001FE5126C|nr:nucleoside deaminase [Chthonobacter rhizosphaerae]